MVWLYFENGLLHNGL